MIAKLFPLLGGIGLPLAPSPLATQVADERAFETGLQTVQTLLADGLWDRARERLLPLLEKHRGAPYVFLHRPRVAHALEQVEFNRHRRAPKVEDVVTGDLILWRPRSGLIELRYGADELGDFVHQDPEEGGFEHLTSPPTEEELILHPARFVGPCRIKITGNRYAPTATVPVLLVGADLDAQTNYALSAGFRARVEGRNLVSRRPGIFFYEGTEQQVLAEDGVAPLVSEAGDYQLEAVLEEDSLSFLVNGKEFLSAPRSRADSRKSFGQVGMRGFADVTSITIQGKIESAWVDGLTDAARQLQWLEFQRGRDSQASLPEWLRLPPARWGLGSVDPVSSDALGRKLATALLAVDHALANDNSEEAQALAQGLLEPKEALAQQVSRMLSEAATGETERALATAQLILERHPKLRLVRRFRIATQMRQHMLEEAREALSRELEEDPDDDWAHGYLARVALRAGQLDDVEQELESAVEQGRYTAELDQVNRVLAKCRNGPDWPRFHEYRYDRFVVRTDIDHQTAVDTAQVVSQAQGIYERWLRPLAKDNRETFAVYVFKGQLSYLLYGQDVLDYAPEHTAGLYSPLLDQLLIWNLPEREELLATVRHEAFHQYLNNLVGESPLWFNEGMAEVFEAAEPRHFNGRNIGTEASHLNVLRQTDLVPLETLLYMERAEFYSSTSLHYAEAWALCHMLFSDSRSGRHILLALLDHLAQGKSPAEATRAAYERIDLNKVEEQLREHIDSL